MNGAQVLWKSGPILLVSTVLSVAAPLRGIPEQDAVYGGSSHHVADGTRQGIPEPGWQKRIQSLFELKSVHTSARW
jgi:hypothetical protein